MILIRVLFIIYLISDSVFAWNSTYRYMPMDEEEAHSRKSRLFSFNTVDDEIRLELDFSVPFIKIPVKKSMDMSKGVMANINLGAVLMAGVLTVGAAVVVPALLSILSTKSGLQHNPLGSSYYSPYRTLPGKDSLDIWRYLAILDNALMDINIDTTSCMQRTLCSAVKNSSRNVSSGNGSSMDKIIDGLASNEWLQRFFSDTPFYLAMKSGLHDLDCGSEYNKCTLSKGTLSMILKKFVGMINGADNYK